MSEKASLVAQSDDGALARAVLEEVAMEIEKRGGGQLGETLAHRFAARLRTARYHDWADQRKGRRA